MSACPFPFVAYLTRCLPGLASSLITAAHPAGALRISLPKQSLPPCPLRAHALANTDRRPSRSRVNTITQLVFSGSCIGAKEHRRDDTHERGVLPKSSRVSSVGELGKREPGSDSLIGRALNNKHYMYVWCSVFSQRSFVQPNWPSHFVLLELTSATGTDRMI